MMITEHNMVCFITVAQYGSIAQASKELFMSRQAISQQVRALEESLGTELFDRKANKLELNSAGRAYYNVIEGFMSNITSLSDRYKRTAKGKNPVRVGVMRGLDVWDGLYAGKQICAGNSLEPDLSISILESNEIATCLRDGLLDIAFCMPLSIMTQDKLFGVTFYKHVRQVMLISSNHTLVKQGENVVERAMAELPAASWSFNAAKGDLPRNPHEDGALSFIRYPNADSAFEAAKYGECIILCPESCYYAADPSLVAYDLKLELDYYCIWRKNYANECVKLYVEHILQYFGNTEGGPRFIA